MADKSFQGNLRSQLEAKPRLTIKEKRLLNALNDETPGPFRKRQLAVAEQHARALIGRSPDAAVDWSKVDWPSFLSQLVEFLTKLFALFA